MISAGSKEGTESVEKVKRSKRKQVDILTDGLPLPPTSKRRLEAPQGTKSPPKVRKREFGVTLPRQPDPKSTSSRPSFFLVGKAPVSLINSKLPKGGPVLARLLSQMETLSLKDASEVTRDEVKSIWLLHFGPRLILGKEHGLETEAVDEKIKIIGLETFY